jgi:hypothetical protein
MRPAAISTRRSGRACTISSVGCGRNSRPCCPEEKQWIESYAAEVASTFGGEFDDHGARFKNPGTLLQRFDDAVGSMLSNGRRLIAAVDEAHNELCVASQIPANADPRFTLLEYESALLGCSRSVDFRARTDAGLTLYVDVKTIKPKPQDRWDQFERAVKEGWFPAKIRDCQLAADNTHFILVLCSEGFHWHQDDLEDFVSYYWTGVHRADDPFSRAETKYIADKNITLDRTITRFACMSRPQFEIRHRRLCWDVQPPKAPGLLAS